MSSIDTSIFTVSEEGVNLEEAARIAFVENLIYLSVKRSEGAGAGAYGVMSGIWPGKLVASLNQLKRLIPTGNGQVNTDGFPRKFQEISPDVSILTIYRSCLSVLDPISSARH